jgi:hypothetical protein
MAIEIEVATGTSPLANVEKNKRDMTFVTSSPKD